MGPTADRQTLKLEEAGLLLRLEKEDEMVLQNQKLLVEIAGVQRDPDTGLTQHETMARQINLALAGYANDRRVDLGWREHGVLRALGSAVDDWFELFSTFGDHSVLILDKKKWPGVRLPGPSSRDVAALFTSLIEDRVGHWEQWSTASPRLLAECLGRFARLIEQARDGGESVLLIL